MKTSIIYHSKSGTTKAYAEEIGSFLAGHGLECKVFSIEDYDKDFLDMSDLVLLGCWTNGLMIVAQHPDRAWKQFAKELPEIRNKKLALFTTYKIAIGSMFRKMGNILNNKIDAPGVTLASRSSVLTDKNKSVLEVLINS